MKKYIFLLFNLIYLIGFSTDVKNITRRLSDKLSQLKTFSITKMAVN